MTAYEFSDNAFKLIRACEYSKAWQLVFSSIDATWEDDDLSGRHNVVLGHLRSIPEAAKIEIIEYCSFIDS